ncbi:hypothetical protein D3C78_1410820 [compost metagenome]
MPPARQHFGTLQLLVAHAHLGLEVGFEFTLAEAFANFLRRRRRDTVLHLVRGSRPRPVGSQKTGGALDVEGLAEVAQAVQIQTADHVQGGAAQAGFDRAAEYHALHQAGLAGMAKEGQAIQAGHAQVAQGDVDRALFFEQVQGGGAVLRFEDAYQAQLAQGGYGDQALEGVVFQDQNAEVLHHDSSGGGVMATLRTQGCFL